MTPSPLDLRRWDKPLGPGAYLKLFAIVSASLALLVVAINLLSFQLMLAPRSQPVVQLDASYGRTYKPIVADALRPEVAAFGASWVRDAFDPDDAQAILGRPFFNFGVSGSSPYESRRFLDSILAVGSLREAIVNLNTFHENSLVLRANFGFDERILNRDPEGRPNTWSGLNRAFAVALSGAAIGQNVMVLQTRLRQAFGASKENVLAAYDRFDYRPLGEHLAHLRRRIVEGRPSTRPERGPRLVAEDVGGLGELDIAIRRACAGGVRVQTYYTAHHMLNRACVPDARREMAMWDHLARFREACPAGLTYWVFEYPNAATLEGVSRPMTRSEFYRFDGHPRPTLGKWMLARMAGRDLPPEAGALRGDFGVDLLAMSRPEAEAWMSARKARCDGDWGGARPPE